MDGWVGCYIWYSEEGTGRGLGSLQASAYSTATRPATSVTLSSSALMKTVTQLSSVKFY